MFQEKLVYSWKHKNAINILIFFHLLKVQWNAANIYINFFKFITHEKISSSTETFFFISVRRNFQIASIKPIQ